MGLARAKKTTETNFQPPRKNPAAADGHSPLTRAARKVNGHPFALSGKDVMEFVLSHGGRTPESPPRKEPKSLKSRNGIPAVPSAPLRFIDLFCGIGGFRRAFERTGAKCVFSSDWDKFSRQTYTANFGEEPAGDINAVPIADIPAFDILCGGFPCQPFSLAGVSKKNSLRKKTWI